MPPPATATSPAALTLVLPAHQATGDAHDVPRIAGFAVAEPVAGGLVHAALSALAPGVAAGPLLAAGAGLPVAHGESWAAATPVTLAIHGDDVRIAGRAIPDAAFTAAALAALNVHFADDGIAFAAPAPGRWFARFATPPTVTLVPFAAALGGSLYAHRPNGRDGRRCERWGSEIQMLLHALADRSNVAGRAPRAGHEAADGVWLWGLGAAGGTPAPAHAGAWAAPGDMRRRARARTRRGAQHAACVARRLRRVAARGAGERRTMRSSWCRRCSGDAHARLARAGRACGRAGALRALTLFAAHGDDGVASLPRRRIAARPLAAPAQGPALTAPATTIARRARGDGEGALIAAGVLPALARVLAARGVRATNELDHAFTALPRPDALLGAAAAGARLADAIVARERIVVVADYDADGATACAAALKGLRAMGGAVDFVVPNRLVHGYGLTPEIVDLAAALQPALLVTVDNGVASVDGVAAAAARGIDVLITDHHLPGPALPAPAIVVNPNQPGCGFPSRALAGVGVLFYVLAATRAELRRRGLPGGDVALGVLLDLVALGTVADVVPLDRVNRILVAQGLARLRAGRASPGIAALFAVAGRRAEDATAADLGFVAGPRLNAAGRLDDMTLGIRCLVADNAGRGARARHAPRPAQPRAPRAGSDDGGAGARDHREPGRGRVRRPRVDRDRARRLAPRRRRHRGVAAQGPLRARATVVFARGPDGAWRGSGRSVQGFHLRDALDSVTKRAPALIERFGGHAMAAGLTLAPGPIDAFATAFEDLTVAALGRGARTRATDSDGPLAGGELTLALARAIEHEVWGQGFAPPAFDDAMRVVEQRIVGASHTRLVVEHAGARHVAMLFRNTEPLPARIRAVYRPEVNRWQGLESLQLTIAAWWPE